MRSRETCLYYVVYSQKIIVEYRSVLTRITTTYSYAKTGSRDCHESGALRRGSHSQMPDVLKHTSPRSQICWFRPNTISLGSKHMHSPYTI